MIAHYKDEDDYRTFGETWKDYSNYFVLYHKLVIDHSFNFGHLFMHEIGHNFGLDHPSDDWSQKDEYTSMYSANSNVINYGTNIHARSCWGEIPHNNEWMWVQEHLDDCFA